MRIPIVTVEVCVFGIVSRLTSEKIILVAYAVVLKEGAIL